MDEVIYKYDIFNETDIHCKDCVSNTKLDLTGFETYCERTGRITTDKGYCNLAKRKEI